LSTPAGRPSATRDTPPATEAGTGPAGDPPRELPRESEGRIPPPADPAWLGQRRAGDTGSYGSFYARFWDVRPSLDFPFLVTADPDGGRFQVGHLWFLVCLLAFSLLLLPGFEWLRRPRGARLLERLGGLLSRPGGLLLPAWNRGSYALFLLAGYVAAADPRVAGAFQRRWRPAAALGLLLFLAAGVAYAAAEGHGGPFTAMDPLGLACSGC
jgi:hypothetical protein